MTMRNTVRTTPIPYIRNGEVIYVQNTLEYSRYLNGSNTANFRNLRGSVLPDNPCYSFVAHRVNGISNSLTINKTTAERLYQESQPFSIVAAAGPNRPEVFALRDKLYSKVRSELAEMDVNIAQMFAERKQVENLLVTTATRVTGAFSALRKGNLRGAADRLGLDFNSLRRPLKRRFASDKQTDNLQRAADAWLELTYGWKPLIQDAYGSALTLAKAHDENRLRPQVLRTSVRAKSADLVRSGSESLVENSSIKYDFSAKATVRFTRSASVTADNLGLTNPALLAWELLPYSFVIDWFLPVGNYLAGSSSLSNLVFHSGSTNQFLRTLYSRDLSGYVDIGNERVIYHGVSASGSDIEFTRSPLSGFPANPLPRFKNPFSGSHFASAIALLKSRWR